MIKIEKDRIIEVLSVVLEELERKTSERIYECVNNYFLRCEDKGVARWNCKSRYCPICSISRKKREYRKIKEKLEPYSELLFLTLTGKAVKMEKITEEKKDNNLKCKRLLGRGVLGKIVKGGVKKTEVNRERDGYKPHIHIILAVKSRYRHILQENRMDMRGLCEEIRKEWNRLKGSESLSVDIQGIKKGSRNLEKVISYLTTYREKRMTEMTAEEVRAEIELLRGREIVYIGELKKDLIKPEKVLRSPVQPYYTTLKRKIE